MLPWYVGREHVAALIVAGICLVVSALLLSYAMHEFWHAVAGVAGVFFCLMGWTAVRMVTGDLSRWRGR